MQNKINNIKNSLLELKPIFNIDFNIYFSENDLTFVVLLDVNSNELKNIEDILDKSITNFYSLFPEFMYTIEFQDSNSFKDITNLNNFLFSSTFNFLKQIGDLGKYIPLNKVNHFNIKDIEIVDNFIKLVELQQNYKKSTFKNFQTVTEINTEFVSLEKISNVENIELILPTIKVTHLTIDNKKEIDRYRRNNSEFTNTYKNVI